MPLPSRNASAGRPVVLDTALLPLSFLPSSEKETIFDFPCPDGSALHGNPSKYCCKARRSEDSPTRMSFARHSSLTDLTQRSAYEFKFGLLAGKRIGFTLPDSISSRKDSQNFVSRSCSRPMVEKQNFLSHRGLTSPKTVLRRLNEVGIFAQAKVSLEHQHLARRHVVRGIESGGAVGEIG